MTGMEAVLYSLKVASAGDRVLHVLSSKARAFQVFDACVELSRRGVLSQDLEFNTVELSAKFPGGGKVILSDSQRAFQGLAFHATVVDEASE